MEISAITTLHKKSVFTLNTNYTLTLLAPGPLSISAMSIARKMTKGYAMPDTTPTEREREAARELVWQRICRFEELEYGKAPSDREACLSFFLEKAEIDRIATALAQARLEALTEAAQVARSKTPVTNIDIPDLEDVGYSNACDDIATAIEALRGSGEESV